MYAHIDKRRRDTRAQQFQYLPLWSTRPIAFDPPIVVGSVRVEACYSNATAYTHDRFVAQMKCVARIGDTHQGCVNSVEFDPSGEFIVTGSDDTCCTITRTQDFSQSAVLETQHVRNIFCAVFQPQTGGGVVVSCGLDGRVCRTVVAEGRGTVQRRRRFLYGFPRDDSDDNNDSNNGNGNGSSVILQKRCLLSRLVFDPTNPHCLYASADNGTVIHIDTRTNKSSERYIDQATIHGVNAIAMSPAYPYFLAVGSNSPAIDILDTRFLRPRMTEIAVGGLGVSESYFTTQQSVESFLSLIPGKITHVNTDGVGGLSFSARGDAIVANYKSNDVFVVNLAEAIKLGARAQWGNGGGDAQARKDQCNRVFESYPNKDVFGQPTRVPSAKRYRGRENAQTMFKEAIFFLNDRYVVTGGDSGLVHFWERRSGKLVHVTEGDNDIVNGVTTHPSKPYIVSNGIDNTARVIASCTGQKDEDNTECWSRRNLLVGAMHFAGDDDDEDDDGSTEHGKYGGISDSYGGERKRGHTRGQRDTRRRRTPGDDEESVEDEEEEEKEQEEGTGKSHHHHRRRQHQQIFYVEPGMLFHELSQGSDELGIVTSVLKWSEKDDDGEEEGESDKGSKTKKTKDDGSDDEHHHEAEEGTSTKHSIKEARTQKTPTSKELMEVLLEMTARRLVERNRVGDSSDDDEGEDEDDDEDGDEDEEEEEGQLHVVPDEAEEQGEEKAEAKEEMEARKQRARLAFGIGDPSDPELRAKRVESIQRMGYENYALITRLFDDDASIGDEEQEDANESNRQQQGEDHEAQSEPPKPRVVEDAPPSSEPTPTTSLGRTLETAASLTCVVKHEGDGEQIKEEKKKMDKDKDKEEAADQEQEQEQEDSSHLIDIATAMEHGLANDEAEELWVDLGSDEDEDDEDELSGYSDDDEEDEDDPESSYRSTMMRHFLPILRAYCKSLLGGVEDHVNRHITHIHTLIKGCHFPDRAQEARFGSLSKNLKSDGFPASGMKRRYILLLLIKFNLLHRKEKLILQALQASPSSVTVIANNIFFEYRSVVLRLYTAYMACGATQKVLTCTVQLEELYDLLSSDSCRALNHTKITAASRLLPVALRLRAMILSHIHSSHGDAEADAASATVSSYDFPDYIVECAALLRTAVDAARADTDAEEDEDEDEDEDPEEQDSSSAKAKTKKKAVAKTKKKKKKLGKNSPIIFAEHVLNTYFS